MIIYGSRNKQLAKEHITEKCPNCGTPNSIDMHVFQKYAHVFWIPFFPMGKTGASQCDHCKQVLQLKEMPSSLKTEYENLKSQTKTPIWTFAGLAFIAVIITVGVINDKVKDQENAKLILAPQAGDIFEIKNSNTEYTIYKVDEVKADSVFVLPSNYEVNKESGLKVLKSKDFSTDRYTKAELKEMLEKGNIINIDRK